MGRLDDMVAEMLFFVAVLCGARQQPRSGRSLNLGWRNCTTPAPLESAQKTAG